MASALSLLYSCDVTPREKEFWEVDDKFQDTTTWKTYTYAYAYAFSIMIPPYMRPSKYELNIDSTKAKNKNGYPFVLDTCTLSEKPLDSTGNAYIIFRDSLHESYAYIKINYIKGDNGAFLDHLQSADLDRFDSRQACDMLIKQEIGTGKLIKERRRWMMITQNGDMYLDICYQRVGNTKGEGPVTVHIFLLQNVDEAIEIVASYHDKHRDIYKDLFNIVETFKWKEVKYKRHQLE